MRLLLFIAYFFIEIYLIIAFSDEFGIFSVFLEMIVSAFLGLAILTSQRTLIVESYRNIFTNFTSFIGKSFFRLIGGILLILPGILSDIIGVLLFIISLFFFLHNNNNTKSSNNFNNNDKSSDDTIIDVEIVEVGEKHNNCDILEHNKKV